VKGHSNKGLNLKQLHKNFGYFFVEWWCHQIQIHHLFLSGQWENFACNFPIGNPTWFSSGHLGSEQLGCLSQRSSKCLMHIWQSTEPKRIG